MRIAIFGTGGMGRELADICRAQAPEVEAPTNLVFVRDDPSGPVDGIEVVAPRDLRSGDRLILALGNSADRRKTSARFAEQLFATVISRTAIVSPSARIGPGSALCDYTVVNNAAVIGSHFQANVFSQVSHDCVIGDFVTFAPRVSCNGWVHVEDDVQVGAGAVIRNGSAERPLRIGRGAVIGMGAVVTVDVEAGATVLGNPARPHQPGKSMRE